MTCNTAASRATQMVEYPGCSIPDWYTKTEYERVKNAFEPGDRIWIDGIEQPKQLTLMDAADGR